MFLVLYTFNNFKAYFVSHLNILFRKINEQLYVVDDLELK